VISLIFDRSLNFFLDEEVTKTFRRAEEPNAIDSCSDAWGYWWSATVENEIFDAKSWIPRLMKRLKLSISVLILHSAISSAPVLTLSWRFVFGTVKRDWFLILALETTFNVHYFFYVVLELVTNSLPYTVAMMIIFIKSTIKSLTFFFSV
jgi:hypothetical protein